MMLSILFRRTVNDFSWGGVMKFGGSHQEFNFDRDNFEKPVL
jgi:hypothetical protein